MAQPYVAMIDYGTGNVHSLGKALERVGCVVRLTGDPRELAAAAGLVLPGVGAFGPAWQRLLHTGLAEQIRQLVAQGRPLLGVCLGMQLLFEGSDEDGDWTGLGLLPGRATRFDGVLKVPHMGWNRVTVPAPMGLLRGLDGGFYAYFVHSYRVTCPSPGRPAGPPGSPGVPDGALAAATAARGMAQGGPAAAAAAAPHPTGPGPEERTGLRVAVATYGTPFVAAVECGCVYGTQFHPEKSGPAGLRILQNFGAICGACDPGH